MVPRQLRSPSWNPLKWLDGQTKPGHLEFFEVLFAFSGTYQLPTMVYHRQTSGQAMKGKKKVIIRLWYYVTKHQKARDVFLQLLKYVYNSQSHISTSLSSFSLIISASLPEPTASYDPTALPTDASTTASLHAQKTRLLHLVATKLPDSEKGME